MFPKSVCDFLIRFPIQICYFCGRLMRQILLLDVQIGESFGFCFRERPRCGIA